MTTLKQKCITVLSISLFIFVALFTTAPQFASARTFKDAEGFADAAAGKTFISQTDVRFYLGDLANRAFTLIGLIFFILMFYAGFVWFTAHGDEEKVTKAKTILKAALIGIGVVVAAYAITNFIIPAAIKIGSSTTVAQ